MADTAGTPKDATATGTGTGKGAPASNRSSRKRKADELSDEETEEETPPHLPAPVWGRVLDFMPYSEVRSALLVGKLIAVEAVKYVQALNVMKGCQMHIPAARRFTNVEEVNILCLLELTEEENNDGKDTFSISLDVSIRAVPFFGSFAKLARGFIGGLNRDGDRQEYYRDHFSDDQDVDLYRSLLSAYVGALKSGALSEKVAFEGMYTWSLIEPSCRQKSLNCKWCRNILSHFPLDQLLPDLAYYADLFCQTEQEAWDIVRRRPDIDKGFSEASGGVLCEDVGEQIYYNEVKNQFRAAAVENLPEKWRLSERECENLVVWSLSQSDLQQLDELIEKGFDPKYVTRKFALKEWRHCFGAHDSDFYAWARTTVESLAARGFPLDCDCLPVIDDKYNGEKYSE